MLSIFICEDDQSFLDKVKQCAEKYILMENLAMSVVCATTSPHTVLNYLRSNEGVAGLYFLDLDLGADIDGIKLAEGIRAHAPRGFIVFITSSVDSYKLTFERKVEAMDYIVKDDVNLEQRICQCLANAYAKFTAKATPLQDNFVFRLTRDTDCQRGTFKLVKDCIVSIDSSDIMYFKTSHEGQRTVEVYTFENRLEFRGNLSSIEDGMDTTRFFRCQRNLIVNLENIKVLAIDSGAPKIIFANDLVEEMFPRKFNALKKRFMAFKNKQNNSSIVRSSFFRAY